jgi:hypothetical protein
MPACSMQQCRGIAQKEMINSENKKITRKKQKMKKQRGLRRYYKNLAIKNDFEGKWSGYLDYIKKPDAWFDTSHWHFDWRGFGNHSFKKRKPHLDKLFRHFELLVEWSKYLKNDFQLFALILDNHSASDAVFLHTSNPNNNDFPLTWANLSKTCTLKNQNLVEYVNQLSEYEKLYGIADEPFCILVKKGIGIPKPLYQTEFTENNLQNE